MLTPFTFRWVTGSWENVWLLVLPPLAFFLPILIVVLVLPKWAVARLTMLEHAPGVYNDEVFVEMAPRGVGLSLGGGAHDSQGPGGGATGAPDS